MTKKEFIKRFKDENIQLGEYDIELDEITDTSYIMGCCFDQGVWKIYKTGERHGNHIIRKFEDENAAFDYFYELIIFQQKLSNQ